MTENFKNKANQSFCVTLCISQLLQDISQSCILITAMLHYPHEEIIFHGSPTYSATSLMHIYHSLPYFSARCERVSASDEPIIVAWHSYIERFIFPKESLHSTFCCIPYWMTERGGNQFGIVARLNPNPNFHSTEETITNTYVLWIRPSYFSYPHE